MISSKNISIFVVSLLALSNVITYGDVIGSDNLVSVESSHTFSSGVDNRIANFGFIKNGFTLQDSLTTCTFDSIFPVSGNVQLNGGVLYLNQDLLFNNVTNLQGLGSIVANNHLIQFCSSITSLPSNTKKFQNAILQLNRPLTINNNIIFEGSNIINGGAENIIMDDGGSITVAANTTLILKNLNLKNISSNSIILADNTSKLILNQVLVHLIEDVSLSKGSMTIIGDVVVDGSYTFLYASSETSTIAQNSQLCFKDGATFRVGKFDIQSPNQPIDFFDETSILKFDQSNFIVTGSGMQIKKGKIEIDKFVQVDMQGTTSQVGLLLGDNTPENDCIVQIDSGSSLRFGSGYLVYNCASPYQIVSSSDNTEFIRSTSSHMYVAQNIEFPTCSIVFESNQTPPIEVAPNKIFGYNNVQLVLPNSLFNLTCNRYDQNTLALDGNDDYLFLTKGTMPLNSYIAGAINKIEGTGNVSGKIIFADSAAHLNINLQGSLDNDIILNGGTLQLGGDLHLGSNVLILNSGFIDVGHNTLHSPVNDFAWTNSTTFSGIGGAVSLHGNAALVSTVTCIGSIVIDGNGNTLEFGSTGQIIIAPYTQVRLKNIVLNGLSTSNLVCADDTSSIILDNVSWFQDGDYLFDKGSIQFVNNVTMYGGYTFMYDSYLTSTVSKKSTWYITNGMQLSIGKKNDSTNVQPIAFTDLSSYLTFDNASLIVNENGVQFTKGTVATVRDVQIDVVSTASTTGLILGDGTAAGDMIFEMYPGCSTRFIGGAVVYNITNIDGILSRSSSVNFIRDDASIFWLNQDLKLANLSIGIGDGSSLYVADGKNLIYSHAIMNTLQGSFELNGTRYNYYTTLLSGNQSIFMIKGYCPMYTLVAGTGNAIEGNGNLNGAVIFAHAHAELTWLLNGTLSNQVYINGGSLILGSDFNCANGVMIIGNGTVRLQNHSVNLGQTDLEWADSLYWDGTQGVVNAHSNISLSNTWTFSGACILDCNNHILDISNGAIEIEKGSMLTIKNAKIQNIAGAAIGCLDDTSSLLLDNVTWLQKDDSLFDKGSFAIKNDVVMGGKGVFAYQSNQLCTISNNSSLMLDHDFTFSYDSTYSGSNNRLMFADQSSRMTIKNANLYVTGAGLKLLKGALSVDGNCTFSSEISSEFGDPGITFGDCNANNDFMTVISGGSQFTIAKGSFRYKNVKESSFAMLNSSASIWMSDNTSLYLYQNLNGSGMVTFGDNVTYGSSLQAQLLMGTNQTGILNNVVSPSC